MESLTKIPLQSDGLTPFPSEDISPETKETEAYGLILGKAIYYTSANFGPQLYYHNRTLFDEYINYAIGEQGEDKYKPLLRIDPAQSATTWVGALRWAIKNYATKRINIAVSKISERRFDPVVDVLDQSAIDAEKTAKNRIKFYMDFKKEVKTIESLTKQSHAPPEVADKLMPESQDELNLWFQTNFKLEEAIILEKTITHHMERQRYQNIKRKTAFDTFVKGAQVVYVGMDANMLPEVYWCNPADMILPSTEMEDYSDMGYAGHMLTPTIPEFYKMAGDSLSREAVKKLIEDHAKTDVELGYKQQSVSGDNKGGDQGRMVVMRFAYKSYNEMVHVQRKDKDGNDRTYRRGYEEFKGAKAAVKFKEKYGNTRKLDRRGYYSIYEGFYVIGSETVFRYGMKHNQERSRGDLGQTALPYKVFAPNIQNNRLVSTMKQMIPVLDELQTYHIKKQHILATAIPAVWSIDLKALRDANFSWNDKKMTDQDKIMFLFQAGIFAFDSGDRFKSGSSYQPIRNLANSVANEIMMYVTLIATGIGELDEIIGFNKVTAASTLRPDTLKGTAEIQENSSEVALDYLYRADSENTLEVIKSLGILTRQSIIYNTNGYYDSILSKEQIELIKKSTYGNYGFRASLRPTQKRWEKLYLEAKEAVLSGAIGWDDYMDLQEIDNLKEARNLFRISIRKAKEFEQNSKTGIVASTGDEQRRSNQQTHDNQMKVEQNKAAQDNKKSADALTLENTKHKNKMQQIRLAGKIKSAAELLLEREKDGNAQGKFIADAVIAELAKQAEDSRKPTESSQKPVKSQNNS